jgi:hypothetical protein
MPNSVVNQALADEMVAKAVSFCADKKFTGETKIAYEALHNGRCDACDFLSYSLVRQIAELLGRMDKTVRAVYMFGPDNAPVSLSAGKGWTRKRASGINLVAWVDRKTPALWALGETLENAIAVSRRNLGCVNASNACYNLNIHLVDDREANEGSGYGTIVRSMYVRSIQVWNRVEQFERFEWGAGVRQREPGGPLLTFNPELAPEEMLFEEALSIERMPPELRVPLKHRLQEEKVVLIRKIISDQLDYIRIAKDWLTIEDLIKIRRRKIGNGKIGGKAAGLVLAAAILAQSAEEEVRSRLYIPESYYMGSDLIYIFMSANGLSHWNEQKYKPQEQIHAEYARIQKEFTAGEFPPDILEKLQDMLDQLGPVPVIVRSSSQLEDSFGTSFAGKYDSYFCPNQGTRPENLRALTQAIALTYASTLKPEALLYRRSKGLQDYDERMAILIQEVQGERFGRYFLPQGAGVAFSRNLYRWDPQIRRQDGYMRLVWGLGTRAVERVGNDYPRLVALSHPHLQPDDSPQAIRHYSQQYVDLIDMEANQFTSLPIHSVLKPDYPSLRYLTQIEEEGYFSPLRGRVRSDEVKKLAITYGEYLRRTPFVGTLTKILRMLEKDYHSAVDIEFTVQIQDPTQPHPDIRLSLLQCRPQSHLEVTRRVQLPQHLTDDEIVLATQFMVPQGYITGLRYVLFVVPEAYYALPSHSLRREVGRAVSLANARLEPKSFICVGPGRWGTTNSDLGVFVSYADIHNSAALVELSGRGIGPAPEPSLGTHFFQDLMEAQIYPLALFLDRKDVTFNRDFFYNSPNFIQEFLQLEAHLEGCLKLIQVASYAPGCHIELVMDDEANKAVAYLAADAEGSAG